MSYPSQPSYTPPYGQPQPPNRSNNLWLGGTAIIIVLIVVMTVTLLILQRSNSGSTTGDGGTEEPAATAESEPTAEDTTEPPEDEDDDGDDDGGTAPAGFTEDTCSAFDLALFEEIYGTRIKPSQTHASASSSGDTGTLNCNFYTADADTTTVSVSALNDADSAVEWLEGDKEFWGAEDGYEVTDFTDIGDDGYHVVFGEEGYQKRGLTVIAGALYVDVSIWIDLDEHDPSDADEYLQEVCEQALAMVADDM